MSLRRRVRRLERRILGSRDRDFSKYRTDPVAYCSEVLGVKLTPDQERVAGLLLVPPFRVLVPAGHNVGKSFLSACITRWRYDCFRPGKTLTTAPTQEQVNDILWSEVRELSRRAGLGGFASDVRPILQDAPNHWAKGKATDKPTAFQGRHNENMAIIVDEAVGLHPSFWPAIESMLEGESFFFLGIYNPTDVSSPLRLMEEKRGVDGQKLFHVVRLSQETHPNLDAERRGLPPPYMAAIHLATFENQIVARSEPVPPGEERPGDVEVGWRWVNGERTKGRFYRPKIDAEARNLGRWPSQSVANVWSVATWNKCREPLKRSGTLQIGVDVARYGSNRTAFAVRWGGCLVHLWSVQGWSTAQTATRAKELAEEWAAKWNAAIPAKNIQPIKAKDVPIVVDDSGVGGGVTDQGDDYNFLAVCSASTADDDERYPRKRDELWFGLSEAGEDGLVSFGEIPAEEAEKLRNQLFSATYSLDIRGRRVVCKKDEMAERLGGESPDEADAVQLAYCKVYDAGAERVVGNVTGG